MTNHVNRDHFGMANFGKGVLRRVVERNKGRMGKRTPRKWGPTRKVQFHRSIGEKRGGGTRKECKKRDFKVVGSWVKGRGKHRIKEVLKEDLRAKSRGGILRSTHTGIRY